jgi:protein O-mannosyl-transferase
MATRAITNLGFLSEFRRRHEQMTDRPFCWVLGSGASVQSGIPSGAKLVQQWLAEMHEMENGGHLSIAQWATAATLEIPGFEYPRAANFYPWIYQRRFRDYKEQGYAFLEKTMDKAEPSFGYSVLAQIMANLPHNVAVTTNFDNLVADALSIYTRTFPLVCGHESLTGYIRPNLRRPLIAKIHRDLLLAPLSNPDEISKLPGEWNSALTKIFDRFTPIVVGYGGNDGSLMNFLGSLRPIDGGIFWCHRHGSRVDNLIEEVVERHRGRLVPIAGFDELMLQLQEKLQLPSLLPQLQSVHDKRRADYQRQFEVLTAALTKPAESPAAEAARKPVRQAAEAAVERLTKEKDWWAWNLKAKAEADPIKAEAIYREGLEEFPASSALTGNFANFMSKVRHSYDEAESLYRRAVDLDPNVALYHRNFAIFMGRRKNLDEAERLFRRAVDLDPANAQNLFALAEFMHRSRQDLTEAEQLYRRALDLAPNNPEGIGFFAVFVGQALGNLDEAERLYRRSLELDPNGPNTIVNFAQFLAARGLIAEAHDYCVRAWTLHENGLAANQSEVAFTHWLLDRVRGLDGGPALGRLRTLLEAGFERANWTFDGLLAGVLPKLPASEQTLARKLASAILDETKVAALDDEPLWREVTPIALSVPWPDDAV